MYMLFPALNILTNNQNDPIANFLHDNLFINRKYLYGKLYSFGKPVSQSITGCNVLIWSFKRENKALDEYFMIMSTKVIYGADAYIQTHWLLSPVMAKRLIHCNCIIANEAMVLEST